MIKIFKFKIIYLIFFEIILFFCLPVSVIAVEIFFEPDIKEMGVGQEFIIHLMINTQEETINALEGKIIFPDDILKLKDIQEGGSIISLWIDKPFLENNEITFSGIIPAGFSGIMQPYQENDLLPGEIISLIFVSQQKGEGNINFKDGKILLHDGKGTPVKFINSNFKFTIQEDIEVVPLEYISDITLPEIFEPEIIQNNDIFDGNYFLIFNTQDKESGIDYYAVFESKRKKKSINDWMVTESPYILKDQSLKSYIYVKAVDKAGNERIVVVNPKYPLKWYEKIDILVIIILILISSIAIYLIKKQFLRNKK